MLEAARDQSISFLMTVYCNFIIPKDKNLNNAVLFYIGNLPPLSIQSMLPLNLNLRGFFPTLLTTVRTKSTQRIQNSHRSKNEEKG